MTNDMMNLQSLIENCENACNVVPLRGGFRVQV